MIIFSSKISLNAQKHSNEYFHVLRIDQIS